MPSISFIFAHPDDETFAVGGTIATYSGRGVRCDLFCATNGDAGRSSDVPVSSREELGAYRRNELISAARILGIDGLVMPGHPDGALAAADQDVLLGEIVRALRTWRPEVVVTFGPEGGRNTHRDHRAISRAATAAFFLAGLETAFPEHLGDGLQTHQAARLFYCAWLPPKPDEELKGLSVPPTARVPLDDRARRLKRDAFLAHVTQRTLEPRFDQTEREAEYFAQVVVRPELGTIADGLLPSTFSPPRSPASPPDRYPPA